MHMHYGYDTEVISSVLKWVVEYGVHVRVRVLVYFMH